MYAATPPSECLRLMLSRVASGRRANVALMYADVSRAYFYAKAVPGDGRKCGKSMMSMYGTLDAALNWALECADTLRAAGYRQGTSNPCFFGNPKLSVFIMVHGDDFIGAGPEQHLKHVRETIEGKYKIKTEVLGCGGTKTRNPDTE